MKNGFEEILADLEKLEPIKYAISKRYFKLTSNFKELSRLKGMFCYLLIKNNDCIYCGISKSIRHRIVCHTKDKYFDYVILLEFNADLYWRRTEKLIIKTLLPIYNNAYNPNKKSEIKIPPYMKLLN